MANKRPMTLIHITIGKLWKISLGHGNSFWLFPYCAYWVYCMLWEVLSKLLILNFFMENKLSREVYFQIKILFKIGMVLLLRNVLYRNIF